MTKALRTEVTWDTVPTRFAQLVQSYRSALPGLGYSEDEVARRAGQLEAQLSARLYRNSDSPRPIWHLVTAKRVTRFHLRSAIEQRPAAKARRDRLQAEYLAACRKERERNPCATFFSFEAAYAGKLRVDIRPFRALFRLTPKSAESVFS